MFCVHKIWAKSWAYMPVGMQVYEYDMLSHTCWLSILFGPISHKHWGTH